MVKSRPHPEGERGRDQGEEAQGRDGAVSAIFGTSTASGQTRHAADRPPTALTGNEVVRASQGGDPGNSGAAYWAAQKKRERRDALPRRDVFFFFKQYIQ